MDKTTIKAINKIIKEKGFEENVDGEFLPKLLAFNKKGKTKDGEIHDGDGTEGVGDNPDEPKAVKKRKGRKPKQAKSTKSKKENLG